MIPKTFLMKQQKSEIFQNFEEHIEVWFEIVKY